MLVLQLKRFWFDEQGPCKILRDVRFEEQLRIPASYLFGDAAASCPSSGGGCQYRLFAVLVHHGARLGEGHYTVFARYTLPASGAECGPSLSSSTASAGPLLGADTGGADDEPVSEHVNAGASRADATPSARPAGTTMPMAEQWLHFDDERVTRVTLHRVLAERAGAYLLFYERVLA